MLLCGKQGGYARIVDRNPKDKNSHKQEFFDGYLV